MAAYRIQFPRGMDVNEYATKVTPAAKSLGLAVRGALWLGEGKAPERELPVESPRERPAETVSMPLPASSEPAEAAKEEAGVAEEPLPIIPGTPDPDAAPTPDPDPVCEATPAPALTPIQVPASPDPAKEPPPPSSLAAASPPEPDRPSPIPPTPIADLPPPSREPPPAYRIPPAAEADVLEHRGEEYWLALGDRRYRVRGLERNLSAAVMKVNLLVSRELTEPLPAGAGFHVDTLDLYLARPREAFAKRAALELGCEEATLARDLGRLLLALETAQDEEIREALTPRPEVLKLSDEEREEALALLRSPDLLGQILQDFKRCGVVGEEVNKLAGYLAATSRKLDHPLAIVVQSNSAAGKSALQEAVLAFMPDEEQVSYSALTGQALYYLGESDLRHKILAIAEEEGAQKASYALKLLQSEGRLKIASTGKDPVTGRLKTEIYEVEGPVMIFLTTTAIDVDEELMNRCLVLTVDEGREQTEAIHREQRSQQTLEGKLRRRRRREILRRHRNAQRLLRPLIVHNPFAHELTFQGHQTRFRRDHQKYLGLIETVSLLHQYQREVRVHRDGDEAVEYIEVTREDIAIANRLAHEILGRSVDELPPQTRAFLQDLVRMVAERCRERGLEREDYRFTRREVREWTGVGNNRAHIHLSRLEELEYVLIHSGRRGKSLVYELLYEGSVEERAPFFPGLLEVGEAPGEVLADEEIPGYDPNLSGVEAVNSGLGPNLSPPIRPLFGGFSGGIRTPLADPETRSSSSLSSLLEAKNPESPESARLGASHARTVVPGGRRRPSRGNGTELPGA